MNDRVSPKVSVGVAVDFGGQGTVPLKDWHNIRHYTLFSKPGSVTNGHNCAGQLLLSGIHTNVRNFKFTGRLWAIRQIRAPFQNNCGQNKACK
jgi:hypothetical protein